MSGSEKLAIQELLETYTPLRSHGVTVTLSYPSSGCLRITHKKPLIGTTRAFIEGLLIGAGLCPTYYPDAGPHDCSTPFIDWRGPER